MKKIAIILATAIASMSLFSCQTDLSGIEQQIDNLDSRLTSLEKTVKDLNTDVKALQAFATSGQTIKNFEDLGGGAYRLILGDNTMHSIICQPTYNLNVSIDADGYWTLDGNRIKDKYGNDVRATGDKGDKGEKGDTGAQGEKGDKGDTGAQGEKGDKGDTGAQGEKGDKGDTGAQGEKGDKGDTGAQGEKGEQGDTGAQGEKGDKGDTGEQGEKGEDGVDGANGKTPIFGVDADGYWTVKFEENETPAHVLDTNGNKVKASGGTISGTGNSLFKSVTVNAEGTKLTITLNGEPEVSYTLPIAADFICQIETGGENEIGIVPGQSKTLKVTLKGVANIRVDAPQGWKASFTGPDNGTGEGSLTITAPKSTVNTKAMTADNEKDVILTAYSASGLATISKVSVTFALPTASITAGTAAYNSLGFNIASGTADAWYCLLKKSSETAPTAAELKATAKTSEKSVTVSKDAENNELDALTSYTLYVLPVYEDIDGTVVSLAATTADYPTLYLKYMNGRDIKVGDKTINKTTYGDAVLLTAEAPSISTNENKVYFIDEDVTATYDYANAFATIIVMSNKEGERSTLKFKQQYKVNNFTDTDLTIFSGINIDASELGNNLLVQNKNGAYEYLHLNDCHILTTSGKSLTYVSTTARSYKNFIMTNCDYPIVSANNPVISLGTSEATYENITFKNNVFYNSTSTDIGDLALVKGSKAGISSLTMTNNSFINLYTKTESAVYVATLTNAVCEKNLIYADVVMKNNSMLVRAATYPTDGSKMKDNIFYRSSDNTDFKWLICFGGSGKITNAEELTEIATDPFTGGTFNVATHTFKPATAYAAYGAQR